MLFHLLGPDDVLPKLAALNLEGDNRLGDRLTLSEGLNIRYPTYQIVTLQFITLAKLQLLSGIG